MTTKYPRAKLSFNKTKINDRLSNWTLLSGSTRVTTDNEGWMSILVNKDAPKF
jgi:hypothetical protein